jgi:hypothetical protein
MYWTFNKIERSIFRLTISAYRRYWGSDVAQLLAWLLRNRVSIHGRGRQTLASALS